jgi:hypothetical protein
MAKRPQGPAVITRVIPQRERADCAIAAMASFSGRSYEDVLREVVLVDPKEHGRNGLHDYQIRRVMRALGVPVRHRMRVDYDEDYGMLRCWNHLAVLRNGLIVHQDAVWDVDVWRAEFGYRNDATIMGIFVAVEP